MKLNTEKQQKKSMTLKKLINRLVKLIKFQPDHSRKREKAQIINGRNVRGESSTVPTDNERIMRHHEQLDANKSDNLDEMDKSLERQMTKSYTRNR